MLYPVGSIYLSVNAASPATIWGGTWEQIQDRFLLAAGSTYSAGTTGGAATHTLTTSEMPAHTHTRGTMNIKGTWSTAWNSAVRGFHNLVCSGAFYRDTDTSKPGRISGSDSGASNSSTNGYPAFDASKNWTGATSSVGGNTAHNNMPPYLAVYIWKRTA